MTIGELLKLTKENCAAVLSAAMRYEYENGDNGIFAAPVADDFFKGLLPEQNNFFTAPVANIAPVAAEEPKKTKGSYILPEKASKWSVLLLTEKELQRMPKKFRPDFRIGHTVAHVRQKTNGVYEIRCQIDKRQITASSKNLETAKNKFIVALKALDGKETPLPVQAPTPVPAPAVTNKVTLKDYMLKWLETVKKPMIKENTYKLYIDCYYKSNICPALGDKYVNEIKPFELQELINKLVADGKTATANQCKVLLKAMFEYAVIDDIIIKSPMGKVVAPHYESEEGIPLSREEEKRLVDCLIHSGNIYVQAYVFMLYTGLRKSELKSIEVKDGWVNLLSAKGRKGYKVKPRSVPVSPMLAPLLPLMDIDGIRDINTGTLTQYVKDYIKPHHVHELRHTFITRCQECGIRREIVSLWAGHNADSSVTTAVYTHLEHNKNIQLDEIKKFKYTL